MLQIFPKSSRARAIGLSVLAAGSLLCGALVSAPESQAMTVRQADSQGCTVDLDAGDISRYLQFQNDSAIAAGDFFMFNAQALGISFTQTDRDNYVNGQNATASGYIQGFSGYENNSVIRTTMSQAANTNRIRGDRWGEIVGGIRQAAGTNANALTLANEMAAGPGRLGVLPNAYALTFGHYVELLQMFTSQPVSYNQMRAINALLRKDDVDRFALAVASRYDLYRATLDGCGAVAGANNSDISGDLTETIKALSLNPGQFYNAKVVRFPFTLLPAGSSVPGM
ncbi:MAG: hypothetical protein Q3962_03365 [Corynebacterium sp.]|nr:hypothetical protein [Corynebacterium sp.]